MKPFTRLLLAVALFIVSGTAVYFWLHRTDIQNPSPKPSESRAAEDSDSEIRYPVPADKESVPKSSNGKDLDPARYKDETIETAMSDLVGKKMFGSIFNLDDFARRIVVAVDSATGPAQLPPERSPLKPLESPFIANDRKNPASVSPDNFLRYKLFITLANSVDPRKLIALYVHFYPTLQSAYRELGTKKYFNDRVVEVIDHILKTPEVAGYPHLVRPSPHYQYKYADVELENLSASQKLLLRMGYDNAQIIKAKLRQIRRLIIRLQKKT